MEAFDELNMIILRLRAEGGCPWDREQTHLTLKAPCIEEAAELVSAVNILEKTGNAENLKEELGDLLMLIVMHARIAEEEGLFTIEDVARGVSEKMIRRHPHVFGDTAADTAEEVLVNWEKIKAREKEGKIDDRTYLAEAFDESAELIGHARRRKGL